jgi:hypothetical protein
MHGIDGGKWKQLLENDTEEVDQWIEKFSHFIWYAIYTKKQFITLEDEYHLYHYHCMQTEMHVLRIDKLSTIENDAPSPSAYQYIASKNMHYAVSREEDMHKICEAGGILTDGTAYKKACLLWAEGKQTSWN